MDRRIRVASLAKPVKKGLGRLLFSRFFIIFVLLVIQVAFMIAAYMWFVKEQPVLLYAQYAFSFAMIFYLFNSSMDSSAKLTWMLIMSVAPFAGAVMLYFTESNLGHRIEKGFVKKQIDLTRSMLAQPENVLADIEHDGSGVDDLSRYLNRTGCFPVYDKTDVRYFPLGEDMFYAMLDELEKAEKYIFMEYFIIEEGFMWGSILDILERKAKEGVEIRVMYDGMCEISTLPVDYWKLLVRAGIHAKAFSQLKPVVSSHYNYRDHRKILVIDGKTAFNGGVNLADEYINRVERFGHWKDTAVMLKGPAAESFTLMFLQMWNIGNNDAAEDYSKWLSHEAGEPAETSDTSACGEAAPGDDTYAGAAAVSDNEASDDTKAAAGYVMPYCDCPLDEYKAGEAVYMDILSRATDYVYIMTPYLILDGRLLSSIMFAAQRGVDVRIILPGIPDKKIPYALAKTHYKALNSAGVKLYEYTPGFVHSKLFVSDDSKAVVGTINLDYRSLYHHFECATYMYKTGCIKDIRKDFDRTLSRCRLVTDETIKNEAAGYKIAGFLAKSIAPLM